MSEASLTPTTLASSRGRTAGSSKSTSIGGVGSEAAHATGEQPRDGMPSEVGHSNGESYPSPRPGTRGQRSDFSRTFLPSLEV